MYLGNLLLYSWSFFFARMLQTLADLIPSFIYLIWSLIARVVDAIEGIFRNLAGIGTSDVDMVSEIINSTQVKQILGNLIGLCTVVIVFFTILKIIQDHYKDKEGGNPYKIIIRTFKGMLMFFFVQAAVAFGLYASRFMFRALDAATGTGSASVSGLVFKSMAQDANRMNISGDGDASEENEENGDGKGADPQGFIGNMYWKRINSDTSSNGAKYGKYYLAEISNQGKVTSGAALVEKYLRYFPIYERKGNEITVLTADSLLKTSDDVDWDEAKAEVGKYLNNYINGTVNPNNGVNNTYVENGQISASAGWKADILQGIDLIVTPKIELTWSPIDIETYHYQLKEVGSRVPTDITIAIRGNSVTIPKSTLRLAYGDPIVNQKSLEDSAKMFGITMKGGVALQGGEACASFSLNDTMHLGETNAEVVDKTLQLVQSVLYNVVYTNLFIKLMEIFPTIPGETSIGPMVVSWVQLFAPALGDLIQGVVDLTLKNTSLYDEKNGKWVVEPFSDEAKTYNGGIWTTMNSKSKFLTTTIEHYRLDSNWTELYGQILGEVEDLRKNLEKTFHTSYQKIEEGSKVFDNIAERIGEQENWQHYMAKVDSYNTFAGSALSRLGNMLRLWNHVDTVRDMSGDDAATEALGSAGYNSSINKLESDIKSTWVELVNRYNDNLSTARAEAMSKNFADPRMTTPVYKPIIEFDISNGTAEKMSCAAIHNALTNNKKNYWTWSTDPNDPELGGNITVNLLLDDVHNLFTGQFGSTTETPSLAYRLIDWGSYGPAYKSDFPNVADLICENTALLAEDFKANTNRFKLAVANMTKVDGSDKWDEQGGMQYFVDQSAASGRTNVFWECSRSHGSNYFMKENSYWGTKGIVLDGDYENPVFHYYEGTSLLEGVDYDIQYSIKPNSVNLYPAAAYDHDEGEYQKALVGLLDDLGNNRESKGDIDPVGSQIVTIKPMDAGGSGMHGDSGVNKGNVVGSVKTMDSWMSYAKRCVFNGNAKTTMIYELGAEDIDNLMATRESDTRRYLMISKNGFSKVQPNDNPESIGNLVGKFYWTNTETVNALYKWWYMNYMIGFIGIISAAGVYLSFAFGLIQRAINLAVLYMMSPVTIAFFPFDDGQKFNSSFVTPFYKEAISAFAVIISLNLFIVLLDPLQDAVKAVAPGLGWLGLVAFVSMLPKIRESITSILGAASLSEKKLSDVFKSADNALGLSKAKQRLAKGIDGTRKAWNRFQGRRDERLKDLENKRAQVAAAGGDTTKLDNKIAAMKAKQDKRNKNQNAIDAYMNAQKTLDDPNASAEAKEAAQKIVDKGLNKRQKNMMKRQKKAAEERAAMDVKRDMFEEGAEGDKKYQAALAARKNDYLQDSNFKKSVSGVLSKQRRDINKAKFASTFAGSLWHDLTGPNGKLAKNDKSVLGAIFRANNSVLNNKERKQAGIEHRDEFMAKYGIDKQLAKTLAELGQSDMVAEQQVNKAVATMAANDILKNTSAYDQAVAARVVALRKDEENNKGKSDAEIQKLAKDEVDNLPVTQEQYMKVAKERYMREKKMSESEAIMAAGQDYNDALNSGTVSKEYLKLGGEEAYKKFYNSLGGDAVLSDAIANGFKELKGLNVELKDANLAKARDTFDKENAGKSASELQKNLDDLNESRRVARKDFVGKLAADNGAISLHQDEVKNILKNATPADTLETLVNKICEKINSKDADGLKEQMLAAGYTEYAAKVQNDEEMLRCAAALEQAKAHDSEVSKARAKWGYDIPVEAIEQILAANRNYNDTNMNSTNTASLGYALRQVYESYKANGDEDSLECKKAMEEVSHRFKQEFDALAGAFNEKYRDNMRYHDTVQKHSEEMDAAYNMSIAEEIVKLREKSLTDNLTVETASIMVKDGHIRDLHATGDYAGAGRDMQMLGECIIKHDYEGALKLGFDEATVNGLKNASRDALEGWMRHGMWESANMGSILAGMGGATLLSAQSALSEMTRIAEVDAVAERLKVAANSYGQEEGRARSDIEFMKNSIHTTLAGPQFEELKSMIKDQNGNICQTQEQMFAVLRQNLEAMNQSTANMKGILKSNFEALAKFQAKDPTNTVVVHAIEKLQGAFNACYTAEKRAADANAANQAVAQLKKDLGINVSDVIKNWMNGGK